jgi:hypothetical protein
MLRNVGEQLAFSAPASEPEPKVVELDAFRAANAEADRAALAKRAEVVRGMLSVTMAIATIIAARLLVLVGLGVAAGLAFLAISKPSVGSIIADAVFDILVLAPLIWLAARR